MLAVYNIDGPITRECKRYIVSYSTMSLISGTAHRRQQCANDAVNGSSIKQHAEMSVDRDHLRFIPMQNLRPAKTMIRHTASWESGE